MIFISSTDTEFEYFCYMTFNQNGYSKSMDLISIINIADMVWLKKAIECKA